MIWYGMFIHCYQRTYTHVQHSGDDDDDDDYKGDYDINGDENEDDFNIDDEDKYVKNASFQMYSPRGYFPCTSLIIR